MNNIDNEIKTESEQKLVDRHRRMQTNKFSGSITWHYDQGRLVKSDKREIEKF